MRGAECSWIVALAAFCLFAVASVMATEDLSPYVVGVYVDEGAHPSCSGAAINMFRSMGFSTRRIFADDVNEGSIDDLAVIYFPGGDSPPYIERITPTGRAGLRSAVAGGMAYIGTCAGAMFSRDSRQGAGVRADTSFARVWDARRSSAMADRQQKHVQRTCFCALHGLASRRPMQDNSPVPSGRPRCRDPRPGDVRLHRRSGDRRPTARRRPCPPHRPSPRVGGARDLVVHEELRAVGAGVDRRDE